MTNNVLADLHPRVKFVDDTSAIVCSIHNLSVDHNMTLNPIKCKEMLINFMLNSNFTLTPLVVDNNGIARVSTYKILVIFIDSDLKWNSNVDYIYKKACRFSSF